MLCLEEKMANLNWVRITKAPPSACHDQDSAFTCLRQAICAFQRSTTTQGISNHTNKKYLFLSLFFFFTVILM